MTFYEWIAEKGIVISGVVDILPALEAAWNDATKAEREACAKVCEEFSTSPGYRIRTAILSRTP